MRLLFLLRERRNDNTAVNHQLVRCLRDHGHECDVQDPLKYIHATQRNSYVIDEEPFPIRTWNWVNSTNYDAVCYSNLPLFFDARGLDIPTFFIYDEFWKGVRIPKGTQYIISTAVGADILEWSDHNEFLKTECFPGLISCIYPELWKPGDKTIDLAYMGIIRPERAQNIILRNTIWKIKQKIVTHMQEKYGLYYPEGGLPYNDYVKTFPHVKTAVHFSIEEVVGMGAWEAMSCGALLIEYPKSKAAEEQGLIHGENCFLFTTLADLDAIMDTVKNMGNNQFNAMVQKGMELAQTKSYITRLYPTVQYMEEKVHGRG